MAKKKPVGILLGKTIVKAWVEGLKDRDDVPFLFLQMSDGTTFRIEASHDEEYTGNSRGEYPDRIQVKKFNGGA